MQKKITSKWNAWNIFEREHQSNWWMIHHHVTLWIEPCVIYSPGDKLWRTWCNSLGLHQNIYNACKVCSAWVISTVWQSHCSSVCALNSSMFLMTVACKTLNTEFPRLDTWASISRLCIVCPASKRAEASFWRRRLNWTEVPEGVKFFFLKCYSYNIHTS